MFARLLFASLGLSTLAALTSCQSSGRYAAPGYAAAAVGVAAAGAAVSRAAGGCLAECLPGTHCNHATGLCERGPEVSPSAGPPAPRSVPAGRRPPVATMQTSYPPGHEFEVPPLSSDDAGCAPPASLHDDAGAVACEMDGGTI